MNNSEIVVNMEQIQKSFPGVMALNNARITLKRGEVHGLVGENGAGKSTLMKILCGIYERDSGTVRINGREVNYRSPGEALNDGISMIHQELNLMPHLTVADNIYIGREPHKAGILNEKKKNLMAGNLLRSLNLDIDPEIQISRLSVAKQQMVEIAKALSFNAEILVMDEPTAALTTSEIDELFRFIASLKTKGVSIVYISHRMEELKQITDGITVMRDGCFIDTVKTVSTEIEDVIQMMVGRTVYEEPKQHSMVPEDAPIVLKVENLQSRDVKDVSFELRKGEILGIAGLMGAGRTETARLIFGADPKSGGRIYINNEEISIKSPEDAVNNGIGYLSEDRKQFGLAVGLSVADNVIMADMNKVSPAGILDEGKISKLTSQFIKKIKIKTPSANQIVRNLSGGNQQKVVIAKWLLRNSDILIFDEPTRGIDVGAKSEIYKLMNQLASDGKSMIMISSEMSELLRMSDRVLVMCEGKLTGEIKIEDASQESIMKLATKRN